MSGPTLISTGNGPHPLPPPTAQVIDGALVFTQLPMIDLAERDELLLAAQIRRACLDVGFFYIKNHPIPPPVIARILACARQFFALPLAQKQALDIPRSQSFMGYTPLLGVNTDPANAGDWHEGFNVGLEEEGQLRGNVWPAEEGVEGFREGMMGYFNAVLDLGKRLFRLFALSLSLPADFFDDKIRHPAAVMRLLHYPAQPPPSSSPSGQILGIGAHSDYECFTLLLQDRVPALQVLNAVGQWITAPPVEGTFVVNLGDQFARWTNGVYVSTVHRAVNASGEERYSVPFFFGTDYDVMLEPIPSCVSPDRPARYEVVTAGEYVKSRLEETYTQSKKY